MSEYHLDIMGDIDLSDYSKIHDYMAIVGEEDRFTITLCDESLKNSDIVYNMLKDNRFIINSKGGTKNGKLHITASRDKR